MRHLLCEKQLTVSRSRSHLPQIAYDGVAGLRAKWKLLELALFRAPDVELLTGPVEIIECQLDDFVRAKSIKCEKQNRGAIADRHPVCPGESRIRRWTSVHFSPCGKLS